MVLTRGWYVFSGKKRLPPRFRLLLSFSLKAGGEGRTARTGCAVEALRGGYMAARDGETPTHALKPAWGGVGVQSSPRAVPTEL